MEKNKIKNRDKKTKNKIHMPVPLFLITLTFTAPQTLAEHLLGENSFASAGHLKTYKDKQDTALNSKSKLQSL